MEKTNKCPKCGGEFKKGWIIDAAGDIGHIAMEQEWGEEKNILGNIKPCKKILNYRCKNCGYLESYAK